MTNHIQIMRDYVNTRLNTPGWEQLKYYTDADYDNIMLPNTGFKDPIENAIWHLRLHVMHRNSVPIWVAEDFYPNIHRFLTESWHYTVGDVATPTIYSQDNEIAQKIQEVYIEATAEMECPEVFNFRRVTHFNDDDNYYIPPIHLNHIEAALGNMPKQDFNKLTMIDPYNFTRAYDQFPQYKVIIDLWWDLAYENFIDD